MVAFVDGLAVGLMVVGLVIFVLGVAARMNYLRNMLNPDSLPQLVVTLGSYAAAPSSRSLRNRKLADSGSSRTRTGVIARIALVQADSRI
jgi:hypothetical protein